MKSKEIPVLIVEIRLRRNVANGVGMKSNWLEVDRDGFRKILARRGKEFVLFELLSNAWDEDATVVTATLSRPENGCSVLTVTDDSPAGWRDFAESHKKSESGKRGLFNAGEKNVLALCTEAQITTTTGQIRFNADGTRTRGRAKRESGSEFIGTLRLTLAEYDHIVRAAPLLIPPVRTIFNGSEILSRLPVKEFEERLPTVKADAEGMLRNTARKTTVRVYETLPGETATLYEMGIPVVETADRWHVDVQQKCPLNADRDNVTPAYLRLVRVALLNQMNTTIGEQDANALWVRQAASDPKCSTEAISRVLDLRFGTNRVSYDPGDVGSNREAASRDYVVVSGGSLSAGEWESARTAGAITPAGALFPTDLKGKTPDKVYSRDEWTPEMERYAELVERLSQRLIGRRVAVRYIKDRQIVCGTFNHASGAMTVNLAKHALNDPLGNYGLMLHELAHNVVRSNDHLCCQFYESVTELGAKLALLALEEPEIVRGHGPAQLKV
jgi:hypothetical protein